MSLHRLRTYRFETAAQWQAGEMRNWSVSSNSLLASAPLRARSQPGTQAADAYSAIAFDAAGTLNWLRANPHERVRASADGVNIADRLSLRIDSAIWQLREWVVGRELAWVLAQHRQQPATSRLIAVSLETLHAVTAADQQWHFESVAAGENDGLWGIACRNGDRHLVSVSPNGSVRRLMDVDVEMEPRIAKVPRSTLVALLDMTQDTPCVEQCWSWRVRLIDLACAPDISSDDVSRIFWSNRRPVPCPELPPPFRPDLIAVDCEQTVYVAESGSGELMAINLNGDTAGHWHDAFDRCQLPLHDLTAQHVLAASGSGGVYSISAASLTESDASRANSVFLTPMLVSPDGIESGWSRLDMDVSFSGRSRIEVRVAHTSRQDSIDRISSIQANNNQSQGSRLQALVEALPWDQSLTATFTANAWPAGSPLRVPLHTITSTHIWLMVSSFGEESNHPVTLQAMRVGYPNLSYSSYLPAVFQEDETAAAHLRNLLSIFESVFGDLDTVLAELPTKIDPRTAPTDWIPYLMQWLGLPVATELSDDRQRQLLLAAPNLLRWRGTRRGLDRLLELILDRPLRVIDLANGPAPWTLPIVGRHRHAPRLGEETLVLCTARPGFIAGRTSVLDEAPLGYRTVSTRELFERATSSLRIVVASETNDADSEALLRRFLPYFVPAHCRVQVRFVDAEYLLPPTVLSADTEFRSPGDARLGASMVLGHSRTTALQSETSHTTILDSNTVMNAGDYLN